MARTFTTFTEKARQQRWAEVIPLLEITLYRDRFKSGGASATQVLRFSDIARYELGQEWLPLVARWGWFKHGMSAPGALDVLVSQRQKILAGGTTFTRFADMIRHGLNTAGTFEYTMCDAALYLLFKGDTAGGEFKLSRLIGEEPVDMTVDEVMLRFTTPELFIDMQDGAALTTIPPFVEFTSTKQIDTAATTMTWAHTGPSSQNQLLVVGVSIEDLNGKSVSSVVFRNISDGSDPRSFTKAGHVTPADPNDNARAEIWYLFDPPTGTGREIHMTFSSATYAGAGALSILGVDAENPVGTFQSATGSDSHAHKDVTVLEGDLVVDALAFWFEAGSLPSPTAAVGQTERWKLNPGPDRVRAAGSTRRGSAPSVHNEWTWTGNRWWALGCLPVHGGAS